jgi:uroporphyrinogen decarboxylase
MTKRDIIKQVLAGATPPYVPWSFRFTKEAKEKLIAYYGESDLPRLLGNHILELGSDIGFFEDLGNDCVRDVFGVVWDRSVDKDIGNVQGRVLPQPTLAGFEFPNPLDPRFFEDIPAKIHQYPDQLRLFCLGFSLYERAWTLRGMEMMDFYDHPDFVHDLFNAIAEYNIAQIREALKYDIDGVYFGDDWGQQHGLQMGYSLWKEFIFPVLERMYEVVQDSGKYVFIHSCGDVDELFDDLIAIGLQCFNPFLSRRSWTLLRCSTDTGAGYRIGVGFPRNGPFPLAPPRMSGARRAISLNWGAAAVTFSRPHMRSKVTCRWKTCSLLLRWPKRRAGRRRGTAKG